MTAIAPSPSPTERRRIPGGEVLAAMLAAEGVRRAFGIIDGTYFGLYSSLGRHGIELTGPRHESAAAHMAGAWARLRGELGVCLASNGPGVANVLPGVAVEHAEGNRVLLLTSCRRLGISYPERGGTFQYFPQTAAIGAIAKWSQAVPSVDRLAELLQKALRACFTGRPGVVHLDVPENVLNAPVRPDPRWFRRPEQYRKTTPMAPADDEVERAAALLAGAERPLVHAGSGVLWAHASEELLALAERLGAAVTTSWGGRAALDERSPHVLPLPHLPLVDEARASADVVLALGSRLGETDWWAKPPHWGGYDTQRWIQVDVDPEHLGNNRPLDVAVLADARAFLRRLLEALEGHTPRPSAAAWLEGLRRKRRAQRRKLDRRLRDRSLPVHSARVPAACRELFDDDAVLVVDGGNAAIWANFYWDVRAPRALLSTFKMGMLGAGTPQALGAKAAWPERQVCCITGDGAFAMHVQELETAVRNDLPVVFVVLCDGQWGMVKMNQQFMLKPLKTLVKKSLGPNETINADFASTAWDEVARGYGAHGERVADPEGLRGALSRALAAGKPAVVQVDVDPVKHMWAPALEAFKDMHDEPRG